MSCNTFVSVEEVLFEKYGCKDRALRNYSLGVLLVLNVDTGQAKVDSVGHLGTGCPEKL